MLGWILKLISFQPLGRDTFTIPGCSKPLLALDTSRIEAATALPGPPHPPSQGRISQKKEKKKNPLKSLRISPLQ